MVRSEGNMSLENPVTPPGFNPGTVRLVAQCLNHYATPGTYSAGKKYSVVHHMDKFYDRKAEFKVALKDA